MTRRRWIADEFSADRAALTGAHAAHLARALRARVGQPFEVACGERVRSATIATVGEDRVEFTLGGEVTKNVVAPITLLLAIFKFDRMEWAIEKCTELNVTTIIPVLARRTEKHLALAAAKRVDRWRRIAREAAEQSRRASPPKIGEPLKLKEALGKRVLERSAEVQYGDEPFKNQPGTSGIGFSPGREPAVNQHTNLSPVGTPQALRNALEVGSLQDEVGHFRDLRIVLAETERETILGEVLRAHSDIKSLALAVGPEGGWTADELQTFQQSLWITASLGETILRAETAAIAALAIARSEI